MFIPKLFTVLKEGYSKERLFSDITSGIVVGIVALPLAIAFAIASGVSPEKGLFTAIIAGFIISALGGSRVQIGGPTGAFIVIVYGIVQQYGVNGLTIATFIAGVMIMLMGLARLGSIIKFIPHPLIVGFTSGIAIIIFSSQMKDFFGLQMGAVAADFMDKWGEYIAHFNSVNIYAIILAVITVIIVSQFSRISSKIPGSIVAILLVTAATQLLHLPVETIGSKFGSIPSSLPSPVMPQLDFSTVQKLIQPAFTIALLGAIESLLSAVVADGMMGGSHRSNMELVAQGGANIFSAFFGGIPATGAIARTATNVKNGGRTPIAGITHAIVLLLIMLFIGKWAILIPMPCLAGILVVVSYNMSEWQSFKAMLKGPKSDVVILLTTFFLTVLVDLTVAIEIGMVLSAFLFMRRMAQISKVDLVSKEMNGAMEEENYAEGISRYEIPRDIEVFEITGPFFFGAAYKFKESMKLIHKVPKVLIIRMRNVEVIDATGIHTLEEVFKQTSKQGTFFILSGVQPEVMETIEKLGLLEHIGRDNILQKEDMKEALTRAQIVMQQ